MLIQDIIFPSTKANGCRDGFGDALLELGKENPNVVALTADLCESTRVEKFAKVFPERFFDVGVAEQNMMGIAAGLALSGKTPFISSYATFSPGRNWDQLRVSVCYSNANVKIIGAHAGISVGPDGATHQALEDLAMTRVLSNLVVMTPCDYEEAKKMVKEAANHKGPVYIRFGREKTPIFTTEKTCFQIGKANVLKEGTDVTIFACGSLVYRALEVAHNLENESQRKISCEVVNVHTLKPLDVETVVNSVQKTKCAVTVEEHQIHGGLYGSIAECLAQNFPVPVMPVGMPDCFGESGKPEELLEKYGMGVKDIINTVAKVSNFK